ncbi:hypothetical protein [Rhodococcus sp. NPDC006774]|uniref:hypothetical protein n=1 Tax=Rhodococcus sp. NPDC006774 TaxID=3157186 RepID=UPI0033C7A2C2
MRRPGRWSRRTAKVTASILGVLTVGAITGAAWTWSEARTDEQISAARTAATAVAGEQVPRLLSYTPDTVDTALTDASDALTGEFKDQFGELSTTVIAPTSKDKSVTTDATVVETSIVDVDVDSATLLMFVNQTTTTTADPAPALAGSRVVVALVDTDQGWKISDLHPV